MLPDGNLTSAIRPRSKVNGNACAGILVSEQPWLSSRLPSSFLLVDTFRRVWDFAGDLFLVLFLAYLVGSLIIHTVRSLMHIPGMKRPIAIGLVYLFLIGIAAFIVLVVLPATVTQALDLVDVLPGYLERLPGFVERVERELLGYGIEIDLLSRVPG